MSLRLSILINEYHSWMEDAVFSEESIERLEMGTKA
jgi:hypothetical protein